MMLLLVTTCFIVIPGLLLFPAVIAHPCDGAAPNTMRCDPETGGKTFFLCGSSIYQFQCPPFLVFSNQKQACDWPGSSVCAVQDNSPPSTVTSKGVTATGTSALPNTKSSTLKRSTTTTTTTASPSSTTTTTASYPSGTCNPSTCKLPECRCMGTDIPGNLPPSEVPQMVLLTFDDFVNNQNFLKYEGLFPRRETDALKNPNGCRTAATFFVSETWPDPRMVKQLADRGNEIASHSKSHGDGSWWSYQQWDYEIQGMREFLANAIGKPASEIVGMRAPYLALGGENQFAMLQNRGFLYDSSMIGGKYQDNNDGVIWPFTLRYPPARSTKMCDQPQCPARSYPQIWEVPLIRQYALQGQPCSMTDSCPLAADATVDTVVQFLRKNFNRHYNTNRAPFMISLHASWFSTANTNYRYEGLKKFLREINSMPDVWQITVKQMLDWVRNPLPKARVSEIPSWGCNNS